MDKPPGQKLTSDNSQERNNARFRGLFSFLRVLIFIILVILVFGLFFYIPRALASYGIVEVTSRGIDLFAVLMLGVLVGFIELISRYKDAPFRTATTYPGLFYMLINGLVAVAALMMIQLFGWSFIPGDSPVDPEVERWTQVLIAGLGAMSIFRSSVLVIGKGDQEVSIGPSAVLEILLDTIDKEVDRFRGQNRAKLVKLLMKDIEYEDAKKDLPDICAALMQNLKEKEGEELRKAPAVVEFNEQKSVKAMKFHLGLKIIDIVGEDVLRQAINIMKKDASDKTDQKREIKPIAESVEVAPEKRGALLEAAKNKVLENPPDTK